MVFTLPCKGGFLVLDNVTYFMLLTDGTIHIMFNSQRTDMMRFEDGYTLSKYAEIMENAPQFVCIHAKNDEYARLIYIRASAIESTVETEGVLYIHIANEIKPTITITGSELDCVRTRLCADMTKAE